MKVVIKNNETVDHLPREYSRILWYFIARGGKLCVEVTDHRHHCKQLCEGMATALSVGIRAEYILIFL